MNGHRARSNGHVAASRPPTFVRLALLVRPWWRGVVLNLTAALLNQGSGIALGVVSALLVARVATGMRADELPPYLIALAGFAVAKAIFTWLDMWFAHRRLQHAGLAAQQCVQRTGASGPRLYPEAPERRCRIHGNGRHRDHRVIFRAYSGAIAGEDDLGRGAAHWAGSGRLAVSRCPPTLSGTGGSLPLLVATSRSGCRKRAA